MYIGPWQEYRLAKIQDDAIQRLRQEFEAQLRGQLPPGDDDRIRELMQPLMAKMPSLVRSAQSKTGPRNGRSTSSNSEAGSRCSSRPMSAQSTVSTSSVRTRTSYASREGSEATRRRSKDKGNNQETHDEVLKAPLKIPKPKKKIKKAPLTSLEQVQKRKKMFTKWIKEAGNGSDDTPAKEEPKPETVVGGSIVTRLPPIHSAVPANAAVLLTGDPQPKATPALTLPPLHQCSVPSEKPIPTPTADTDDIDLDESVDEEEVNKLLNWTDTLLSPHALDSLCDFD